MRREVAIRRSRRNETSPVPSLPPFYLAVHEAARQGSAALPGNSIAHLDPRQKRRGGIGVAFSNGRESRMPEKRTLKRAHRAKRAGKAPTTQAGEFVREEIHHIREGKHGARSTKQAIAIGLSKARRAGVKLPRPPATATRRTKKSADYARRAAGRRGKPSPRRSRAATLALRREPRAAASRQALSRQARNAAQRRSATARKAAAQKANRTKGPARRRAAAKRAARTRHARKIVRRRRARMA